MACNASCLTCLMYGPGKTDGSPDICLSCPSGQYLLNNTCQASCPDGYYFSMTICALCESNCLSCSNYSSCTTCQTNLTLHQG